ncbi:unnamed protein product [Peniophora sp. CBMAI 1063]|nr:unnamed protein product [Peniophora sp. CBMAI 1063]
MASTPPSTPPSRDDDRPTLPVSQPRSSPRSPPRNGAPPAPISPPKPSISTSTLASSNSTSTSLSSFSSTTSIASNDHRTPNVYINGLPPNFPEDQLYAMTNEFGPVISVRTFTRHVSDRPSGYGFVLFETCDAAEACIEALRKYRNLHPSFSKQVHKIPGTVYANVPSAPAAATDPSGAETFKARMERLKDSGSTNLYIEGLPLSIDEATLGALVAPYPIKSSRFFQTRLSHPPRIIAFVRLESRTACEEVIERLHGRMVRGWNDSGSRISVRFADSAEQRDLRRNERSSRDTGDASAARLTMAQAALLSLRGQQAQQSPVLSPVPSVPPPIGLNRERQSPRPGSAERSALPVHPLTAAYHQQQRSPLLNGVPANTEINLSVLRETEQKNHGFTALEQHLILQAQIDAQRQALADLRLRSDPMATPTATRPLDRLSALSSKEFVPRGLVGRQASPASQQAQSQQRISSMSEEEFHRGERGLPKQDAVSAFNNGGVFYESRAPVAQQSHTRSSTLPPQLMHGNENGPTIRNESTPSEARLASLLSPSLRQGSTPLNISVPGHAGGSAEDSPLLVPSPALTYNSSASSAALSPATPFFGSFANNEAGFGHGGVYRVEGADQEKGAEATPVKYRGVGVGLEPAAAASHTQ